MKLGHRPCGRYPLAGPNRGMSAEGLSSLSRFGTAAVVVCGVFAPAPSEHARAVRRKMAAQFGGGELARSAGLIEISVGETGTFEREFQARVAAERTHSYYGDGQMPFPAKDRPQGFNVRFGIRCGGDFAGAAEPMRAGQNAFEFGGRGCAGEIAKRKDGEGSRRAA